MPTVKLTKEKACYWAIKSAMDNKALTQQRLAKRLGVTQASVSVYMRDIYNARSECVLMMSDIIGVDIFEIMKKYWKEEKA